MKKGDLFTLTHEEYSDYEILATHRALTDFVMSEVKTILDDTRNNVASVVRDFSGKTKITYNTRNLAEWLVDNKYCEPVECKELWLGGYGDFPTDGVSESRHDE